LVRVLTVIGRPAEPDRLLDDALNVLSEVFRADVVCLVEPVGDRVVAIRSCGLAEDDPAFTQGWSWTPTLDAVVHEPTVSARLVEPDDPEVPPSLVGLGIRTITWVPLTTGTSAEAVLGLFRRGDDLPTTADLQMLQSLANRLLLALQARLHGEAVGNLARVGPLLTRHLEPRPLLKEAVDLLRRLVDVERAWFVTADDDGMARVAACSPSGSPPPPGSGPMRLTDQPAWTAGLRGQLYQEGIDIVDGHPLRTTLSVPVIHDSQLYGVLLVVRPGCREFGNQVCEVVVILAGYVAAALSNASLYQALGRSEESLRLITDSISDLVSLVDPDGVLRYVSPSHERELGLDPSQLLGGELTELVHPQDQLLVRTALSDAAATPRVEYRMRNGQGTWVWVESALRIAETSEPAVVLSSRVVEERRRLEQELLSRATHDPLTGLANRALMMQWLEELLAEGRRTGIGLLFCDLDGFKAVNDRLGHETGDDLLLQVAERLRRSVGTDGHLARFGGDEFVVLQPDVADLAGVQALGRRVLSVFGPLFPIAGELVRVSVSVGGVLGHPGVSSASAMLRDADAAMYVAKGRGPGRVEVFDDDASARALDRLSIRRELQDALDAGQFSLAYQPVVDLASGRIRSLEALLRWWHPQRGFISPEMFVPIAEESGLIVPIGAWVLQEACHQLAAWTALPGLAELSVSVNLAPAQLLHPQFPARVVAAVEEAGVRPRSVLLEIIERGELPPELAEPMTVLRSHGLRLAIDDFGMHNSNLGYLRTFTFDCLKIDRSFVGGLGAQASGHGTDRAIVRAVMAIADTLDLDVVAEGIETEEQREVLLSLGCRLGQGYLLSRPLPPVEATRLLVESCAPGCGIPAQRTPTPRALGVGR
jgi:diguanylate cyclase (GGDEF)-like protein/PAS domain S-box-containing protein